MRSREQVPAVTERPGSIVPAQPPLDMGRASLIPYPPPVLHCVKKVLNEGRDGRWRGVWECSKGEEGWKCRKGEEGWECWKGEEGWSVGKGRRGGNEGKGEAWECRKGGRGGSVGKGRRGGV